MPLKIDRKGTDVSVTALVFTGDVEACLQRLRWKTGLSHWRLFRFSVYSGLIIYILTVAASNVKKRTKKDKKDTHFWHEFSWNEPKNPFSQLHGKWLTCVIGMLFDSNNTLTNNLFLTCVFHCRHRISCSTSFSWFCRHIGADFSGRFLTGYRCVKTHSRLLT